MSRKPTYQSEADLCADFIEFAQQHKYTVYPETAGFDMVLVDAAGHQIGVEAKLTLNLEVVRQALPSAYNHGEDVGPDHRAILAPSFGSNGLGEIADFMGLAIFTGSGRRLTGEHVYYGFNRYMAWYREMFDWNPARRLDLPEHVPTTRAGIPSPIQLTPWKIAALKLLAMLEVRGWVTRADFGQLKLSPSIWLAGDRWLNPLGSGRWGVGNHERLAMIRGQHPDLYARFVDEQREAARKASDPVLA